MPIQFSGLVSNMDTQSMIRDLVKAEKVKVDRVKKQKTKLEWRQDAWKEVNTKLYSFYKGPLFKFKMKGTYLKKAAVSSDESVIKLAKDQIASNGSHQIEVNQMAKGSFLTGNTLAETVTDKTTAAEVLGIAEGEVKTISVKMSANDTLHGVTIKADDTIADIEKKFKQLDIGLDINFDDKFHRFFLSSRQTGEDRQIELGGDDATLTALGFTTNRVGSQGQNAKFKYNGATLESASNDVTINGLSFAIQADSGKSTVTVSQNTDEIYDQIKEFVNKYNEVLTFVEEKYKAKSAKGYEPLTAEEKEGMSEEEAKLWEERVKASLLRRDSRLDSLTSTVRRLISSKVDEKGNKYKSIDELGIVTGKWHEGGLLHIAGDEEDPKMSGLENKLKKALEENPEEVQELLTSLGDRLYERLTKEMRASKNSSALTFYNNKVMDNRVNAYDDQIEQLEKRLSQVESRYYRQFAAMEKAMQQAQSMGNWFAQQLGGGQ